MSILKDAKQWLLLVCEICERVFQLLWDYYVMLDVGSGTFIFHD